MKATRFWIEIVALGTAIACALALLIATLGAAAAGALGPQQASQPAAQHSYVGMVTCSRCGAKHSPEIGETAADCTRICVHGGVGFALVEGEKMYLLEGDLMVLKRFAGQRTRVVGELTGQTIRVSSIAGT